MSTKAKPGSTKPVRTPATWQEFRSPMMGDASQLVERRPVNCRVVLARPGMVCSPSDSSGKIAVIETMTPEICIVRFEDGRPQAFFWGEIELCAVQPDPRFIAGRRK